MTSSYSKTSVFVRPHVNKKPAFSKIFTLKSVFEKMRFRWPLDQIGGKNIRFQIKTDTCGRGLSSWALSIQPKIPEILVGTPNRTDHFGLVRPEYLGPALKMVEFDQSGHFGRWDRNFPFHLSKFLSSAPFFCILLRRTITKRRAGSGLQPGSVEFPIFQILFFLNGKRPRFFSYW